ncbi:MAG: SPOR domain-containing protein, partial [Ignavibacteriaceae bacterium]|nr:SPOR domain-containing protein [Ignavibacteriaceae bacterium]
IYILAIISSFIFLSCSASTGSRYESENKNNKETVVETEEKSNEKVEEDFDFAPYRTNFNLDDNPTEIKTADISDIWYGYDTTISSAPKNITSAKLWGYRVQVITTDNLDEANSTRSDLYFKTNQKAVYVIFDPPFYKVKAGDFTDVDDANALSFKLTQIGYNESRVVQDSINVFK